MDTYSSGEDLIIKTRKPYTITKQRERWTEEEHNKFLEALKLYGRAWQRIEEHIGTKTAVQIRSHAQKFFSKLEKEAIIKGVSIGQALDIDIPPPRPKRKPSNPYPRKVGACPTPSQVAAKDGKLLNSVPFPLCKQQLDLEKEPLPEEPNGDEQQTNAKENQDDNCSEVFTLLQEGHNFSVSSVNKNSVPTPEALRTSCSFREFVPSLKEVVNQDATNEFYITIEQERNQKLDKPDTNKMVQDNGTSKDAKLESYPFHQCLIQGKKSDELNSALPTDDMKTAQNYPRHVPVHVVGGSLDTCMQTPSSDVSFQDSIFQPVRENQENPNLFLHPGASATPEQQSCATRSSTHQSFQSFPYPFTPTHSNLDDYRSFVHISSTFSSLIVSTLLQNPAAHAAASFAATFLPYANMESYADSPQCAKGGFPSRQMDYAPSMAAIAASTVAAATAWWAAQGLLPFYASVHTAFACPASATAVSSMDAGQGTAKTQSKETNLKNPPLQDQQLDQEHSETLQAQNPASKLRTMSLSDSEEIGCQKQNIGPKTTDHEMAAVVPEIQESSKVKNRKQVYRSSCGSNTSSSSEVEIDALEKLKKNEEKKEVDTNDLATELSSRRNKSSSNMSDSWKEVSEEGRLAFQALFSREVLPQSFSPPHYLKNQAHQNGRAEDNQKLGEKDGHTPLWMLNNKTWEFWTRNHEVEKNALTICNHNGENGLLFGLRHGKLKARRTGFKPYKRCSVEAKESRIMTAGSQGEEKGPKRIRVEGEAST